ncbi:autotransporter-associated beta strand repeat-containing protein, partial [Oceanibaculum pacificum]|uniref:autotransporter-associated beta strand repeat-containing protein n=1 Tax=Oceanibaculum pacificum TaxID=580166 RepID=UPI000B24CD1A
GDGVLTLSGANSYTGETIVSAGTLLVDDALASDVTVEDGAILGGSGDIAATVTVNLGGTLAAGNSPGILATGDLTLVAGAALEIEIEGNVAGLGGYDQIDVTGTVDLGGATLELELLGGFTPVLAESYTLIANDDDDAVIGTFDGLAEGDVVTLDDRFLSVSYVGGDGNDVVLTVVQDPSLASDPEPEPEPVTISPNPSGSNTITLNQLVPSYLLAQYATEGVDTVNSNFPVFLPDGVENLTLGGSGNLTGVGNSLDNVIIGNQGDNTLTGGDGYDMIDLSSGGDNRADGNRGGDTILGGAGDDEIRGGKGHDSIEGGAGDDVLYSGFGDDTLSGGEGADLFVLRGFDGNFADAILTATVTDFEQGTDLLAVENASLAELEAAIASQTATEAGVIIQVAGASLTFLGVAALTAADIDQAFYG